MKNESFRFSFPWDRSLRHPKTSLGQTGFGRAPALAPPMSSRLLAMAPKGENVWTYFVSNGISCV